MICVPITESSIEEMIDVANSVDSDLVELRLDYLSDFSGINELKKVEKRVIATCMPGWEGGRFRGSDNERISVLTSALEFSDYVSIELKTDDSLRNGLIKKAKDDKVKVIVSYHDFISTPSTEKIHEILKKEQDAGADIGKIAFMANDHEDVLRTMDVLLDSDICIPLIAISIGEKGKISRILGPLFGSYLTFASRGKGKESAAGQLSVDEIKKILEVLK